MILSSLLALALCADDPSAGIQTTTLLAEGAPALQRLGTSADMDNALAAVGASEQGAGRVYVYRPAGAGHWQHVGTLEASDGTTGDRFGAAVSVVWNSPQIIVVGAPGAAGAGAAKGAAYVFRNFGTGGVDGWVQVDKLAPSNVTEGAEFGVSVSATATSTPGMHRIVVGAYLDSTLAPFVDHGAAFQYVFTTSGATLDVKVTSPFFTSSKHFGYSVSNGGSYAAIGEPNLGSSASGRTYVYRNTGSTWTSPATLTPSDAAAGQEFGAAVAMDSTYLAIGARGHDGGGADAGAAYVFERVGTNTWTQRASYVGSAPASRLGEAVALGRTPLGVERLFVGQPSTDEVFEATEAGGTWPALSALAPFDGASGVGFGSALAAGIYPAHLVGAPADPSANTLAGAVYVADTATNTLIESKELPTHHHSGSGLGVAVAADGDRVVVGAAGSGDEGPATGAAYVYERSGAAWTQTARLTAEGDARRLAAFGAAVAVDADTVAVGAELEESTGLFAGAVYVFRAGGTDWVREARLTDAGSFDRLGTSVALRGDRLAAGAPEDGAGVVYAYARNGATWSLESVLQPVGGGNIDRFGASLAMSDEFLVVGAPDESISLSDSGAVHVFARSGNSWSHVQKLTSTNPATGERFGESVDVDGQRVVVGAPGNDANGTNAGAVYVFRRSTGSTFSFEFAGLPAGGTAQGAYGTSVALRGNEIAVGAPGDGNVDAGAGAGYLLRWQGFLWTQDALMPPDELSAGDGRGRSCDFAGPTLLFGASSWDGPVRPDLGAVQVFDVPPGNLLYCTGKTNSQSCVPFTTWSGHASASSSAAFTLSAFSVLAGEPGLLIYGFAKSNLSFHGGKLCVKTPFRRLLPPKSAPPFGPPPCDGLLERNFNNRIQSGADPLLTAGQTVFAQWRLRDPADPAGFGDSLTDAVRFTICP